MAVKFIKLPDKWYLVGFSGNDSVKLQFDNMCPANASLKIAKLLIASGSSYARTSLSDVYQSEFVNGGQETYSTITINSFNSLRDNGIAAGDAGNSLLSSGTGGGFERGDWLEISNMNDEFSFQMSLGAWVLTESVNPISVTNTPRTLTDGLKIIVNKIYLTVLTGTTVEPITCNASLAPSTDLYDVEIRNAVPVTFDDAQYASYVGFNADPVEFTDDTANIIGTDFTYFKSNFVTTSETTTLIAQISLKDTPSIGQFIFKYPISDDTTWEKTYYANHGVLTEEPPSTAPSTDLTLNVNKSTGKITLIGISSLPNTYKLTSAQLIFESTNVDSNDYSWETYGSPRPPPTRDTWVLAQTSNLGEGSNTTSPSVPATTTGCTITNTLSNGNRIDVANITLDLCTVGNMYNSEWAIIPNTIPLLDSTNSATQIVVTDTARSVSYTYRPEDSTYPLGITFSE